MQKFSKKNKQCERFLGKCKNKKKIEKNRKHESRANRCEQVCVWVLGNCARMEKLWNHHEKRCKFFPLPQGELRRARQTKQATNEWVEWVNECMAEWVNEWEKNECASSEWVSAWVQLPVAKTTNVVEVSEKSQCARLFAHSLPPFPRLLDYLFPLRFFQPAFPFVCAILFAFAAAAAQRKHSIFIRFCICSQRESFSGIFMGPATPPPLAAWA